MGLFSNFFGNNDKEVPIRMEPQMQPIQQRGSIYSENVVISPSVFKELCQKYIAFDVETTGLSPFSDRIVELGAVIFENGQAITQFRTLVNPGRPIPFSASQVNHITNEMLSGAPTEEIIYPQLTNYLGDALQGNTIICAHNAKFDIDFLSATLERLGFSGRIRYVDTLSLSRRYLALSNYKQDTVAAHYGFANTDSHRAASDALVCGRILWELLKERQAEIEKQEKLLEAKRPTAEELEVCAVIQDSILKHGGSCQWIGFCKNSNGYVEAHNLYPFLKFKFASKGQYIIIPSNIKTPNALPIEKCSVSEGGTSYVRLYFSSPFNIEFLGDYFFTAYNLANDYANRYYGGSDRAHSEAEQYMSLMTRINNTDVQTIIDCVKAKKYDAVPSGINIGPIIKREDVVINAIHNRCPLSQIKKREGSGIYSKGYLSVWKGDEERKEGNFEAAIACYDEARAVGYDDLTLYEGYAKAYRKLKDYDNEIVIIEEYMERFPNAPSGELEARREKAIELLFKLQQSERIKQEKALVKAQKHKECKETSNGTDIDSKNTNKRAIIQMDDDGNVIKVHESVTLASKDVGVSTKSIRDAAIGVQKHAGGFVWKYAEDSNTTVPT